MAIDPDDERFNVLQIFLDDSYEGVLHGVDAKTAVDCAKRLSESLGGHLGTTRRILITDGSDHTCFLWEYGQGVLYPKPGQAQQEEA